MGRVVPSFQDSYNKSNDPNYLVYEDGKIFSKYVNRFLSQHLSAGYPTVSLKFGHPIFRI